MNDLIFADRELEVGFIGQLDALLEGIERMDASHKASPTIPDGQGSVGMAQSEPTYLAGLPQQRDGVLLPVGWKNPVQGVRYRKATDERLSERLPHGNVKLNV